MAIKSAGVKVSFIIEGEKSERNPNDATRATVNKFYRDVGHAYPTPGKTGEATACRIPEHLVKLDARQAIKRVVLVEQIHAAQYPHGLSRAHSKSGNSSRGNSNLAAFPRDSYDQS